MTEESAGVDLRELFDSNAEDFLILGDPGSGKSTSMASFAVDAARAWKSDGTSLFPIWVSLAAAAADGSDAEQVLIGGVPEVALCSARDGNQHAAELSTFLRNSISSGRALLLLDGLDEVKDHHLPAIRGAISTVANLSNGTRVVATCRAFDYRQSSPTRKVSIERELELLPYNATEQKTYVRRWYAAAVRVGRFTQDQADELIFALVNELRAEGIAELSESPLLLALLDSHPFGRGKIA